MQMKDRMPLYLQVIRDGLKREKYKSKIKTKLNKQTKTGKEELKKFKTNVASKE